MKIQEACYFFKNSARLDTKESNYKRGKHYYSYSKEKKEVALIFFLEAAKKDNLLTNYKNGLKYYKEKKIFSFYFFEKKVPEIQSPDANYELGQKHYMGDQKEIAFIFYQRAKESGCKRPVPFDISVSLGQDCPKPSWPHPELHWWFAEDIHVIKHKKYPDLVSEMWRNIFEELGWDITVEKVRR